MPRERTAVTAGDHIDCTIVSPEAIRLTDSSKVFQNARNCPSFLALVSSSMVLSISALVISPLSAYFMSPRASSAIAASMMPIEGTDTIAVLPLNLGFKRSAQVSIFSTLSGRIPSVSALYTVGTPVAHLVGFLAKSLAPGPSTYCTSYGRQPWVDTFLPSGYSPLVKIGTTLSHHLKRFSRSIGCSVPFLIM